MKQKISRKYRKKSRKYIRQFQFLVCGVTWRKRNIDQKCAQGVFQWVDRSLILKIFFSGIMCHELAIYAMQTCYNHVRQVSSFFFLLIISHKNKLIELRQTSIRLTFYGTFIFFYFFFIEFVSLFALN